MDKRVKFQTDKNLTPYGNKSIHLTGMRDELDWIKRQLEYSSYAEKYVLRYDLKAGEIYEFDWGINVNAEFSNRHYGIVLVDSGPSNPLVTVVPIKTNHSGGNPRSDVDLGNIPELRGYNSSLAVVNQIRTIDKFRLYTKSVIGRQYADGLAEDILEDDVIIPRLEQSKLIEVKEAVKKYIDGKLGFDSGRY